MDIGAMKGISLFGFPDDFTFILNGSEVKCNKVVANAISPAVARIRQEDPSVNEFHVDYQDNDGDMPLLLSITKNGFIDVRPDKIEDFITLCLELENVEIAKQLQKFKLNRNNKDVSTHVAKIKKIPEGTMNILIKHINGSDITLNVNPTDTVEDVKAMICKKEGIPIDDQKFLFNGKAIENDKTLQDYNIQEGCTIHLLRRLKMPHNDNSQNPKPKLFSKTRL